MKTTLDRRQFAAGVATVAAAVAATGRLAAQDRRAPPRPSRALGAAPAEKAVVPLPFAPGALDGLSARLITAHHERNYAGAVRKLNEIRAELGSADPSRSGGYRSLYGSLRAAELAARNSALLHELYFANLARGQTLPPPLGRMLAQRFGSVDRLQAELAGAAAAASGWVVLVVDPTSRTLELVQTDGHAQGSWDAVPLLVLDVFEHAYALDFGPDRSAYVTAFWRNVGWNEVHARARRALGRL